MKADVLGHQETRSVLRSPFVVSLPNQKSDPDRKGSSPVYRCREAVAESPAGIRNRHGEDRRGCPAHCLAETRHIGCALGGTDD